MKRNIPTTIYLAENPAAEYSKYACNFYNGCSARCTYCFNRHGKRAEVLGRDYPILKKMLIDEDNAIYFLEDDIEDNLGELQKHGFLLNFVSDPFLPETTELNLRAIHLAQSYFVPVKILTKQADWVDSFLKLKGINKKLIACGFTLTGHDELEPGAATNEQRIIAMRKLKNAGFMTFASIEPIITFPKSLEMIEKTIGSCDLYMIGLQRFKTYPKEDVERFIFDVRDLVKPHQNIKIYFKDSINDVYPIREKGKHSQLVDRDYNIFKR
ncbi:radical SAM family protein [Dysgonomonas reticulitermitis]